MNELPNELICMVFDHLNLIDLIDNCRLVSKRWLALVDSVKFKELSVTNSEEIRFNNRWYYTFKPINPNDLMFVDSPIEPNPNKYLTIKYNNFSNLKRLKIDDINLHLDLNQLNDLIQLEHLELSLFTLLGENSTLCLPNLRVLCFFSKISKLVINADKLEVLCCDFLSNINLIHPESIKFLELCSLNKDLNQFSNLEVCRLNSSCDSVIDEGLLSKLPNCLKEFHFHGSHSDEQIPHFKSILEDKVNRRRANLKLYLNEIELTNELLDSNQLELERLELYHINYTKLTTLPQTRWIDYSDLLRNFDNVIPKDFFMKFNNIQALKVNKMVNQNQLICFLKGCHHLNVLIIGNRRLRSSNLKQEFYNELPKIASLLSNLQLYGCLTDQIDYKFISEFKLLIDFRTNQHFPSQTAKYLIKNLRFLRTFEFNNEMKKNDTRRVIVNKIPRINEFFIDIQNEYRNSWIKKKVNDNSELDEFFDHQNYLV